MADLVLAGTKDWILMFLLLMYTRVYWSRSQYTVLFSAYLSFVYYSDILPNYIIDFIIVMLNWHFYTAQIYIFLNYIIELITVVHLWHLHVAE